MKRSNEELLARLLLCVEHGRRVVLREEYGRLYPDLPEDPLRRAAQRYLDAQHDRAILGGRLDADEVSKDLEEQYSAVLDRCSNAEIALRVVLAGVRS